VPEARAVRVSFQQPQALGEAVYRTATQIDREYKPFLIDCLRLRRSVGWLQEQEEAVGHGNTIFVNSRPVSGALLSKYPQNPTYSRELWLPALEYSQMRERVILLDEALDTYINKAGAFGVEIVRLQIAQGIWDGKFRLRVGERNYFRAVT
jgi:hypothetical protein